MSKNDVVQRGRPERRVKVVLLLLSCAQGWANERGCIQGKHGDAWGMLGWAIHAYLECQWLCIAGGRYLVARYLMMVSPVVVSKAWRWEGGSSSFEGVVGASCATGARGVDDTPRHSTWKKRAPKAARPLRLGLEAPGSR